MITHKADPLYYFCLMQKLALPIILLWRMWFYVTIFIAIVVLFPFIFITSLRSENYKAFFPYARYWAKIILFLSGFWVKSTWKFKPEKSKTYIVCANHTSMIDIMMTLALFKNSFLFIGKSSLAKFPLFGYFYKRTNILVDRTSLRSRAEAMDRAAEKLRAGIGVCIYPEGGIPDENVTLARFKQGAFRLSVAEGVPIIPVSYPDNKRHFPYSPLKGGYPGRLRAIIHNEIVPEAQTPKEEERLKELCYQMILQPLQNQTPLSYESELIAE